MAALVLAVPYELAVAEVVIEEQLAASVALAAVAAFVASAALVAELKDLDGRLVVQHLRCCLQLGSLRQQGHSQLSRS